MVAWSEHAACAESESGGPHLGSDLALEAEESVLDHCRPQRARAPMGLNHEFLARRFDTETAMGFLAPDGLGKGRRPAATLDGLASVLPSCARRWRRCSELGAVGTLTVVVAGAQGAEHQGEPQLASGAPMTKSRPVALPRLLIVRHEEAQPADDQGDALRALTPLGRRRMHAQARALFDVVPGLDRVWTSPLVRAVQTAEILVSAFDLDTPVVANEGIYHSFQLSALRNMVTTGVHPIGVVAVVGHEPTLSSFTSSLLEGEAFVSYRTGQAFLLAPTPAATYRLEATFHGGQPVPSG